jgi:hypothetical protein
MEDRLLDLSAEIQAGINSDAIATRIAESIRQTFVETELPGIAGQLRLHASSIADATRELSSFAATLSDSQRGAPARIQQATASMLTNMTSAANHIRILTTDLRSQLRHCIAMLCAAALALGFLLGWFLHQ